MFVTACTFWDNVNIALVVVVVHRSTTSRNPFIWNIGVGYRYDFTSFGATIQAKLTSETGNSIVHKNKQ